MDLHGIAVDDLAWPASSWAKAEPDAVEGGSLAEILLGRSATKWTALARMAANPRAILAAHIGFEFVDRRHLRRADDIQGHGLTV
jgi:hypothetical protein